MYPNNDRRAAMAYRHRTLRYRTVRRSAFTLLELTASSFLVGLLIVPTVVLMRDACRLSRQLETRAQLHVLGMQVLESKIAEVVDQIASQDNQGNFESSGFPQYRYSAQISDRSDAGGIPEILFAISVTAWKDANGNGIWDSGELITTLRTKATRRSSAQEGNDEDT